VLSEAEHPDPVEREAWGAERSAGMGASVKKGDAPEQLLWGGEGSARLCATLNRSGSRGKGTALSRPLLVPTSRYQRRLVSSRRARLTLRFEASDHARRTSAPPRRVQDSAGRLI
jgi:hypothetical protein